MGSIYAISYTKRGNILELFDKKVTEADAYLQLLIDQANVGPSVLPIVIAHFMLISVFADD